MTTFYDSYDYPKFWQGRQYEHQADVLALGTLLSKIPKKNKLLEIGAGFGRLAPTYLPHVSQAVLLDPSGKLLQIAASNLSSSFSNFSIVRAVGEKLPEKIGGDFDIALIARVLHHVENPEIIFAEVAKILRPDGYFILEFANKINFKARIRAVLQADFQFSKNTNPVDLRSQPEEIQFLNHHPQRIIGLLQKCDFEIVETLSVSNFRFTLLKKVLPLGVLVLLEKATQRWLSPIFFGPSIFILARKTQRKKL